VGTAGDATLVDVGVVTWNTAELTAGALRRLLDSDQGCRLRLLVHDNASSDGTPETLARRVPEAEIEVAEENLGFARAVNRLLGRSRAPWFLLLNSDAWPEPGAVGEMVAAARRRRRAGAVAPLLLRPDGTVEHSTHPFPSLAVAGADLLHGRSWMPRRWLERHFLEDAWRHDRPRAVDWAVGAAMLLRRDAVEDVGGFDEGFFMYVEDLEWCWRAAGRGWETWFEPAAAVRHVGNASGARRFGEQRLGLESANLHRLLPERMGPGRARAYFALQAAGCGERALTARLRGDAAGHGRWRLATKAALGLLRAPAVVTPPATAAAGEGGEGPLVSVVVASRDRAALLERLLGALEKQTLGTERFEVVVVDDGSADGTRQVLERMRGEASFELLVLHHPLSQGPAAARNRGWRAARAPVVAFTDDDCVPDPAWLESGLRAMGADPVIVVGRTGPPEEQRALAGRAFARFIRVDEARFYETCNVFYRRQDLSSAGGFDERCRRPGGEDTRLAMAVRDLGVATRFAPEALVHHDVRSEGFLGALREAPRWQDVPIVFRGRLEARPELLHRWLFWKPTHPPALLAAAGIAGACRHPAALVLVLPWLSCRLRHRPLAADPWARVAALPGGLVLDLVEVGVMVRGSVRHRTVVL
jgi:GT2 family glycosyltransferase